MEECHLGFNGLIMSMEKIYSKKIIFLVLVFFIFQILFIQNNIAENYYADIEIDVDDSGIIDIKGISNHPDLLVENTEGYTYKKQSYWLLNINKNEIFSDYIYNLYLPEGSRINYINASGFNGIEESNGRIIVTGSGKNDRLSITIQYQINNDYNGLSSDNIVIWIFLFLIIILTILLFYFIYEDKYKEKKNSKEENFTNLGYNLKGLSSRQKKIIELLVDKKRPLTQTDIQKELNIPKAAVSRNVHALEIKGLIEIEKNGMSNLIRLKKI